jgi:DNA-binding LytR/AlgR family response regulator
VWRRSPAIRNARPHLLFLDIQMDPLNGIDLARALGPAHLPSLVFVTAYDTYALEAFEVCAVDYLLKPFDQERFRKTLARVRPRHAKSAADDRQALLAGLLAQFERGTRDALGAAAIAGGVQRPSARARCHAGGNDRGGPQLCPSAWARTLFTRAAPCSRRKSRCAPNPCCASAAPAWST